MKRFKNYGLIMAITSQVLLVAQLGAALFFDYNITEEMKAEVIGFVDAVLILLSVLGIVNNPTSGKGFLDEKGEGN
jgi:uncharacterized membrane protein